ncbi:hypothetical protein TREMEDRAFT_18182, partial [Tremella mesenterica DSM 1558]|uniref:uncharacterized protein n=1 Tax=Tremella mesenterica (strain ATCC 24925 / CBS 8224 / DSM 1558 / NBRC 9311 / NRRL Y-6157 / RJB 2259-6 / UBC 559-6) TaxID=578456 RepID=UPI0003F49C91
KTNVALLTEGAKYIQRAKKERREQVEEIKFDDGARRDWLTGFSKRKKAKLEERRSRAKERDHKEHLEERRKAREELRKRAAQNVIDVRMALGLTSTDLNSNDEEDDEEEEAETEEKFEDADQIAMVSIVEDFDPSSLNTVSSNTDNHRVRKSEEDSTGVKAQIKDGAKGKEKVDGSGKVGLLPPSSRKVQKALKKKKEKEASRSMETKAERRKGKFMEVRNRAKKAGLALERDGKKRGGFKGKSRGK